MQSTNSSHVDVHSIKRIEKRFRQVAEYQGISSKQLKLSLMEHYVNQWLCKNDLLNITVCDIDNDFRRRLFKPVPIFVKVSGFASRMGMKSLTFSLPHYDFPYEHCRIISDEPFRAKDSIRKHSSEAVLIQDNNSSTSMVWHGYIQVFEPRFFHFPHRNEMIEGVKSDISVSIRKSINLNFSHLLLDKEYEPEL